MAVYKSRRKDAAAQFVADARELRKATVRIARKFPDSYKYVTTGPLLQLASEVYMNALKGNSIYVHKDMSERDYELRHRYLAAATASADALTTAMAVGVVVTSLTTGMTTDVDSFMFGSILAMDRADVALSVGLCAAVLVLYVLFYHRLFAITFDESFARATGVKVGLYNTILSVLTALTIVLGMRMMGAMLISSLVIFPALTAMTLLRSFRGVVICAAGLSVVCFCVGLTGSYLWGTPVGATVVLVNLAAFLLSRGVMKLKRAS